MVIFWFLQLFRKIISLDKLEVHERRLPMGAGPGDISINIRRTHVYEDAFEYLSPQNGESRLFLLSSSEI